MIIEIFAFILMSLPIIWIIKLFIYEPIKANKIYKLFNLRDKICIEAMKGNIDESDEDYQLLMFLVNSEIAFEKSGRFDFSITNYIENIIAPSVENDTSVDKFKHLCQNKFLFPYTVEAAKLMTKRINKSLFVLKCSIILILPFVIIFDFIKHRNIKFSKTYTKDKFTEYNNVESKYTDFFNELDSINTGIA